LVLDSPVPADAESALGLDTVAAMRSELSSMCAVACPALDPLGDLGRLLGNLTRRPVRFDNGYSRVTVTENIASETVYQALFAADLDPTLRATLPAALHLAAAGDISALGRLQTLSVATAGSVAASRAAAVRLAHQPETEVENVATTCEDTRWPWSSADPRAVRAAKARAAFDQTAPAALSPFDRKTIFDVSAFSECEPWPEAGDSPPRVAAGFSSIPTLVLSGRNDTRTPNADAAALSASLPAATLVTVPNVGHSVLTSDPSGCSKRALAALFVNQPVVQCRAVAPASVDPLPPASVASLAPAPGLRGIAGRVLTAAVLTLHHDVGLALPALADTGEIEGTRAGYLVARGTGARAEVVLHRLSYIRGLALRGPLNVGNSSRFALGTVRVLYRGRRFGRLTLTRTGAIRGRLEDHAFRLTLRVRKRILTVHGLSPTPGSPGTVAPAPGHTGPASARSVNV
jgi:TAP-like protein